MSTISIHAHWRRFSKAERAEHFSRLKPIIPTKPNIPKLFTFETEQTKNY